MLYNGGIAFDFLERNNLMRKKHLWPPPHTTGIDHHKFSNFSIGQFQRILIIIDATIQLDQGLEVF